MNKLEQNQARPSVAVIIDDGHPLCGHAEVICQRLGEVGYEVQSFTRNPNSLLSGIAGGISWTGENGNVTADYVISVSGSDEPECEPPYQRCNHSSISLDDMTTADVEQMYDHLQESLDLGRAVANVVGDVCLIAACGGTMGVCCLST